MRTLCLVVVLFMAGCAALDPQTVYRCEANDTCADPALTCVNHFCVRADAGTSDAGADAGLDAGLDGGRDGGADAGRDAGIDAGSDGGVDAGGEVTVKLWPRVDEDDGSFCRPGGSGIEELISDFTGILPFNEVGIDEDSCRPAYRFVSPIPRGATITLATLSLTSVTGSGPSVTTVPWAGQRVMVQASSSFSFPQMNNAHVHTLEEHSDAGLVPGPTWKLINGTSVSPDLSALVSALIQRADYQPGAPVTLVLQGVPEPTNKKWWVGFEDSVADAGEAATLTLTWH